MVLVTVGWSGAWTSRWSWEFGRAMVEARDGDLINIFKTRTGLKMLDECGCDEDGEYLAEYDVEEDGSMEGM